jgi:type I restriction enzyme, R subunit
LLRVLEPIRVLRRVLISFDDPGANDWLAVNQFTVIEGQHNRRPDVVIFVNGLPLALIELKNAADEDSDISTAFHQFQTYQEQIPSLFVHNAVLVISDGLEPLCRLCLSRSPNQFDLERFTDGTTEFDHKFYSRPGGVLSTAPIEVWNEYVRPFFI